MLLAAFFKGKLETRPAQSSGRVLFEENSRQTGGNSGRRMCVGSSRSIEIDIDIENING